MPEPKTCGHLATIVGDVRPSGDGCQECVAMGRRDWVHLRVCQQCGHVGCCDSSPGRHATAHFGATNHPLIRSFQPNEDWYWCYVDEILFDLDDPPRGMADGNPTFPPT